MTEIINSLAKKDATISRDIVVALKHYCFYNLSEFYRRYSKELSMARATFFRVMQGDYSSGDKVERVNRICEKLGLLDLDGEGSSWLIKQSMITDLVKLSTKICDNPSLSNLNNLKEFMDNKGYRILA